MSAERAAAAGAPPQRRGPGRPRASAGRAAAAPSAARRAPGPPGLAAGLPCAEFRWERRGEDGREWTGPGAQGAGGAQGSSGGAGGPLHARPGARTAVPGSA